MTSFLKKNVSVNFVLLQENRAPFKNAANSVGMIDPRAVHPVEKWKYMHKSFKEIFKARLSVGP